MERPNEHQCYVESSIEIAAPPEAVYGLVSDLPRMGEWSSEATGGHWQDGATGQVGDWFIGTNKAGDREWTRESEVVVADKGKDFTFVVGGVEHNRTWWSYELEPSEVGTTLTEKWWIVNLSPALVEGGDAVVKARIAAAESMIPATLAAIKATAETGR